MNGQAVSSRLLGRRIDHLGTVLFIWTLLSVACAGCSDNKKVLTPITEAYQRQDFEETIVLCEHALKNDVVDGEIYLYYGMALVAVGRDFEALDRFENAARLDPSLAAVIAVYLEKTGRESFAADDTARASRRLKAAVEHDPSVELGALKYLLADAYFEQRDFGEAARFYKAALEEYPDTAIAEGALFNLASCHLALGDSVAAAAVLERQLEEYPRGALAGQADWMFVNLLYNSARSEFGRGNYDAVMDIVTALLERTENVSLIQRSRFLLGETYERMGEFDNAYEQYQWIIREDRGASGRIVDRARAKIEALRDAGLL